MHEPYLITRQRLLTEHDNRPVLFESASYDQFKKLSTSQAIPVGASWVAALGIIYGPKPKVTA